MTNHRTGKRTARSLPIAGLVAIAATLTGAQSAQAVVCAQYYTGGTNCGFTTQAQCMEAVSGVGGFCSPLGGAAAATAEPARRQARTSEAPKRKQTTKRISPSSSPAVAAAPAAATHSLPAAAAPVLAAVTPVAASPARPLSAQFAAARQLVFDGQYEAGIVALRALRSDDHPDVAAYIGLSYRGLGRLGDARAWYDQALRADPNHLLALMFDGMLRAEQGDQRVARDNLEKLGRLCGTSCSEYRALEESISMKR